jgi:hypothetical protein
LNTDKAAARSAADADVLVETATGSSVNKLAETVDRPSDCRTAVSAAAIWAAVGAAPPEVPAVAIDVISVVTGESVRWAAAPDSALGAFSTSVLAFPVSMLTPPEATITPPARGAFMV